MPGKDPVQAFLLQKYLHFYDQVNDGDIKNAIEIFNDPFQRNAPFSPTANNTTEIDLIETKQMNKASKLIGPDMKIKLSNSYLDSYITKLHKKCHPTINLSLMKV